jgi:LuxR family maltose regulon positive regulatory protein
MPQADTLIRTKLRRPFTRPALVPRPRLQARIAEGLRRPLTLVTAPAGFGKTTLVASCVNDCEMPVAWLSLDKDDNQVARFVEYLVAALQAAAPTLGSEAAQLLAGARQPRPEAVLTSLINDLDTTGKEIALVLDDYQFISRQAVHDQVIFLLEYCPKTFHMVIATRSDPPLPLTRLRARAQMVELRAADLGFTKPEADRFLNHAMGLGLDSGSVAVLAERTEGWIAGLQMAALSMRDRPDVSGFIKGFSGTNRYVLDYLLEEVLAGQPPEIQRFLLTTSMLERLTAPLCDAILADDAGSIGESESDSLSRPSEAILAYLERANLFVIPLDDERTWYRYHHLFADLLRARWQQTSRARDIVALHTRAARWYEQNGMIYEAIHHASLTLDNEWVERLIEENYMQLFRRGASSAIRLSTGKLSQELVYRRPWLCIYEAESHAWVGELDEAEALLAKAEEHLRSGATPSDTQTLLGHLAYIKSRVTAMRGDIHEAIKLGLAARENTPASNHALQGGIGVMLGYGYFLNGDFTDAIQTLNETIEAGTSAGVTTTTMGAYCVLARLHAIQGQLQRSYELYQEAEEFAHQVGGWHRGGIGIVDVGIADILYERNDLETALARVEQGLDFISLWGKADDIALAHTTRARIQQALGNTAAAMETIEQASRVIRTSGVFAEARDAVATAGIRLQLAQGDSRAADRWTGALEKGLNSGDPLRFENELAHITLARVYRARKKQDKAIALLSRLEAKAQSGARTGRRIEILILKALVKQELGDPAPALAALAKSLALAEPEGYVRVFVDAGKPMRTLLARWSARADAGPSREYAIHLLSQFDAEPHGVTAAQEKTSSAAAPSTGSGQAPLASHGVSVAKAPAEPPVVSAAKAPVEPPVVSVAKAPVEPLSPRELEVLHLIALGMTNKEIARQLVVAPGTVKAHTSSIYRKLDVANRTEAAARARQLGMLP